VSSALARVYCVIVGPLEGGPAEAGRDVGPYDAPLRGTPMSTRTVLLSLVAMAVLSVLTLAQEPERPQVVAGRSKVATTLGIVATSQPLASQAGAQILQRGGNAVDAAIAANAVMALVEPHYNGIGGDLFAIYYEARTGKLYGLNAGGWAPAGLTPEFLRSKGITSMPGSGIHTVTVPGAVAGWEFGYGQAVMSTGSGVHFAGSEPRHDGEAIPEAAPVLR
jgi:gamma-glutamyltranspeptidase